MTTVIQFPDRNVDQPLTQRVSEEVRALCGRHAVTQVVLASWLGVSQPAISSRLRGGTEWKVHEIDRIAYGFSVHPAALMGGYATSPRPDGPDGDSLPILTLPWLDSNQQPSDSRSVQVSEFTRVTRLPIPTPVVPADEPAAA